MFFLLLFLPCYLAAQYPSSPKNYVTDEAGVLSQEQLQLLNRKLKDFETASSNQIFVYLTPSLNGQNLESLSQEIFHQWKIGNKKNDNGVLIAVFVNDHKFRIQTGYGLESSLPDLLTKKIQDETMRPYFKQQDFYRGIDKGIGELIYYTAHAYEPQVQQDYDITGWLLGYIPNLLLLSLFTYLLYRKKQHKKRRPAMKHFLFALALIFALVPCIGSIILFFMLMLVINLKSSGRSSGSYSSGGSYWSSSSDSGYSSSSDSGSDFGGGGGGDSGGGGSSSDW